MSNDANAAGRVGEESRSTRRDANAAAHDPLLAYRERFPILARTNYLISNSLGAVPEEVGPRCNSITKYGLAGACAPGKKAGGPWSPTWATSSLP